MFESFDDYDLDENLLRHRAAEFSATVFLFPLLFEGSMKQFFFGDFHSYTHGCRDLKGLPKKSKKLLEGDRRSVCIRVFWYQSKGSSMSIAKHCKHLQTVIFLSYSCRIFRLSIENPQF